MITISLAAGTPLSQFPALSQFALTPPVQVVVFDQANRAHKHGHQKKVDFFHRSDFLVFKQRNKLSQSKHGNRIAEVLKGLDKTCMNRRILIKILVLTTQ